MRYSVTPPHNPSLHPTCYGTWKGVIMNVRHHASFLLIGASLLAVVPYCMGQPQVSPHQAPLATDSHAADGAGMVLQHKMTCWKLGKQAIKDEFPNGINSVAAMNKGMMYYEPAFGYSSKLNTCTMLLGYQLTNFKTNEITTYRAELTDLLSNETLATYALVGGVRIQASLTRDAFINEARELLGVAPPSWLLSGPIRLLPKDSSVSH